VHSDREEGEGGWRDEGRGDGRDIAPALIAGEEIPPAFVRSLETRRDRPRSARGRALSRPRAPRITRERTAWAAASNFCVAPVRRTRRHPAVYIPLLHLERLRAAEYHVLLLAALFLYLPALSPDNNFNNNVRSRGQVSTIVATISSRSRGKRDAQR
jgi:hypothetical protein